MQATRALSVSMHREKHFKTSEDGIIEEVITTRRIHNKV
jgi:hypothetical protein